MTMTKKISVLLLLGVLAGCAGTNDLPPVISDPEHCDIYERYQATPENSVIAAKIADPCLATRLITMAAKLPAMQWERQYTEEFERWAAKMEVVVQDNISYAELQELVLIEVSKLNAKAGMAILIVSDGIFVFDERGILQEKDVAILLGLIQHLRAEVAKMEILMQ